MFIKIECAANNYYVCFWTQVSIWSHARIEIFKTQSCLKAIANNKVEVLVCFIQFFWVRIVVTVCLFEE